MCTTKSGVNTAILNSENVDDDSVLEIIGVIQGKGASTSCRNSGNDSDLIITGFIRAQLHQHVTPVKKQMYVYQLKQKMMKRNCPKKKSILLCHLKILKLVCYIC